jgi:hypothetical protein
VIGSSRFHGYDKVRNEVEIGWSFLARSHWGGAYNGEMKELMLRHAFRYVDNVVFLVTPQNRRSERAVEKIGGIRVGSRSDGAGRDSHVYRITASAFEQRRGHAKSISGVSGAWRFPGYQVVHVRSRGDHPRQTSRSPANKQLEPTDRSSHVPGSVVAA